MKYRVITIFAVALFSFAACTNGESYNQNADTGNMLQDTLPAHNPPVAIPLDSNPPDNTHVDSLNNMSQ